MGNILAPWIACLVGGDKSDSHYGSYPLSFGALLGLLNEVIGVSKAFIDMWRWLRRRFRRKKPDEIEEKAEEGVATRFLKLFSVHGVHKNQIPGFFKHGLRVADVTSEHTLLPKLTEELLYDACKLFNVRREWLDGVDKQIYPEYDFYKGPQDFEDFLKTFSEPEALDGVVLFPEDLALGNFSPALIVIEEPIGTIGDKTIYRYYICNNWLFSYWKSRAYLTACVAIAWKKGLDLIGRYTSCEYIEKLSECQTFLEYGLDSALPRSGNLFQPENMALNPEAYMLGVNPEGKGYGAIMALELWLQLAGEGFMETGMIEVYNSAGIKALFSKELEEKKRQYPYWHTGLPPEERRHKWMRKLKNMAARMTGRPQIMSLDELVQND